MSTHDRGPLPKIHPREDVTHKAELALSGAILDATKDLTLGEKLQVLTTVFSNSLGSMARFVVRYERHGDPDKPGGLE